jgi:hypothetical protein
MRVKLCKTKTEFWASGSSSSATENPAFSEQTIMTPAGHVSEAMLARDSHRAKYRRKSSELDRLARRLRQKSLIAEILEPMSGTEAMKRG